MFNLTGILLSSLRVNAHGLEKFSQKEMTLVDFAGDFMPCLSQYELSMFADRDITLIFQNVYCAADTGF